MAPATATGTATGMRPVMKRASVCVKELPFTVEVCCCCWGWSCTATDSVLGTGDRLRIQLLKGMPALPLHKTARHNMSAQPDQHC